MSNSSGIIYPMKSFNYHTGTVNDVSFSKHKEHIFASCGSDKIINMYN